LVGIVRVRTKSDGDFFLTNEISKNRPASNLCSGTAVGGRKQKS
jgi:hypothetical protein